MHTYLILTWPYARPLLGFLFSCLQTCTEPSLCCTKQHIAHNYSWLHGPFTARWPGGCTPMPSTSSHALSSLQKVFRGAEYCPHIRAVCYMKGSFLWCMLHWATVRQRGGSVMAVAKLSCSRCSKDFKQNRF